MTGTLQEAQLDSIIRRVLEKMDVGLPPMAVAYRGVYATADQALEAVSRAQNAYRRVSIANARRSSTQFARSRLRTPNG